MLQMKFSAIVKGNNKNNIRVNEIYVNEDIERLRNDTRCSIGVINGCFSHLRQLYCIVFITTLITPK